MDHNREFTDKEIPIFFSTDDNYIPFLDVAIASLIDNASKEYKYNIVVLNTGLKKGNMEKIRKNEREGVAIKFFDISDRLKDVLSRFKNVYHFSIATYYRLFIASLFPQYDKIIYLDCDLVVLGDISKLYNIDLGNNILAGVPDQFVNGTSDFRTYTREAIGIEPEYYINAGVLVINLKEFRKNNIEEKFVSLVTDYDFDLLDPDQAYLNYLCRGKILALDNGWNKEPMQIECEGEKNIVHYALYKKPWQYDDVIDGESFWTYARGSAFYDVILKRKESFGKAERGQKEMMAKEILEHAKKIVGSDNTFLKVLKNY